MANDLFGPLGVFVAVSTVSEGAEVAVVMLVTIDLIAASSCFTSSSLFVLGGGGCYCEVSDHQLE